MLNKVLVAKFLTAMTLAGLATGAAAGFDGEDVADDGETIELETPFDDDESTSSDNTDTDDDADAAEEEAEEDADEAADDAADDSEDPTHGSIVSDCARNTEESGPDHGEAVSTVAKDGTAECAGLSAQTDGDDVEAPAPADEADEADAEDEDAKQDKPRAAKAQGADHRNEKATEQLSDRDTRKAGR